MPNTEPTMVQRKALEFLWSKYGNGGNCYTPANHKFLKSHVDGKTEDAKKQEHLITRSCREAFDRIMKDDYSELTDDAWEVLKGMAEKEGSFVVEG